MNCYVGLDVSMKETAICVIDESGERAWAGKTRTDPDVIAAVLSQRAPGAIKICIETGPLTVWLWHALNARGLPIICLHARHAAAALKLQMNKTDRNDAFGLARLVRSGWYRPVAVRSIETHRLRALLITRDQLVGMSTALINKIRGLAKTFGILIAPGKGGTFVRQVRAQLPDDPVLVTLFESLLTLLGTIQERRHAIAKELARVARQDRICRLMMTVPGCGHGRLGSRFVTIGDHGNHIERPAIWRHVEAAHRVNLEDDNDAQSRSTTSTLAKALDRLDDDKRTRRIYSELGLQLREPRRRSGA